MDICAFLELATKSSSHIGSAQIFNGQASLAISRWKDQKPILGFDGIRQDKRLG